MALVKHTAANKNIVPWKPINWIESGKYLVTINPQIQTSVRQNDAPKSLSCSGMVSETVTKGKLKIAQAAMKTINEKLATGIQLNGSTSKPHDFNSIYTPNVIKPKAAPSVDATYKIYVKKEISFFWLIEMTIRK